jgi:predicted PurR-regulated permease PerM
MNSSSVVDLLRPVVVLALLIATVFILFVASKILIPIALGILLSFVLNPAVQLLTRRGVRRSIAVGLVVTGTTLVVLLLLLMLMGQVSDFTQRLPEFQANFREKLQNLRVQDPDAPRGPFARLTEMLHDLSTEIQGDREGEKAAQPVRIVGDRWSGFGLLPSLAGPVTSLLGALSLTIGLTVSMLLLRDDLRNRVFLLLGDRHLTSTTRVMDEVSQRMSRYLVIEVILNTAFGALFGLALAILGVPYPFVWAMLAFCLRFVPYIGTWLAAIFPLLLAIGAPGWWQAYGVLGVVLVLTILFNNVLEPMLISRTVGVTPIALVVSMAFWTWLWGPIGLVLATPITVGLSVLGKYFPALRYFDVLLGQTPPISEDLKLYQRLLARDEVDAVQLLKQQLALEDKTPELVLDEVVLPAMNRARLDADRGQLNAEDLDGLADRLQNLLAEVFGELPAPPSSAQCVLACAGADRLDELAIECLERTMPAGLVRVQRVAATAMAGDVLAEFAEHRPAAVLLSLFPPTGNARARYLAKRLDQVAPETPLIAGLWTTLEANDPLPVQLTTAGVLHVGTSLAEVRSLIVPLVQVRPHLVRQETALPALPS